MNTYAFELVRRFSPHLQAKVDVQLILPLHIKLQLERLRLIELIGAAGEKKPDAIIAAQAETPLG